MSETAINYDYPPGASPAEIWAILRETTIKQDTLTLQMQETDRQLRLQMQETDRKLKEFIDESSRQRKEADKKFGELSNRFGELAEHLVAPNIREKFNALGLTFGEVSKNKEIVDDEGNSIAEIDILLENDTTVMVVEVKAKPNEKDVDKHIKRMEVLRRRADTRKDARSFLGAIAGAIMTNEVRNCIIKNGFYAIEQTGDTVKINVPESFKPRRW